MAGGAAKKTAERYAKIYATYTNIMGAVYAVTVVLALWNYSSYGFMDILGLSLLTSVNYVCLDAIFTAAKEGMPYTNYEDVWFVNCFVQVMTLFSNWFWLFYLAVPGYVVYKFGGTIKSMCCGSCCAGRAQPEEEKELTAVEKKRVAKKEKKAARGNVKYGR